MKNFNRKYSQSLLVGLGLFSLMSCGGGADIETTNFIPVKSGDEYQYINRSGDIKINPQFLNASAFRDGLALVQTSGEDPKWGFINEDGKYVVNANYDEATVFRDGVAWVVKKNSAPQAIDTEGESIFTLNQAERVRVFSEGLAAFSVLGDDGEKWGFVNKTGEISINPQFSDVSKFKNDLCAVKNKDGKWGFINKSGEIIINYQFDNAENFINGTSVVSSGGKFGIIDTEGSYLINPQYAKILHDNDIFLINQNGKWGWADSDNNLIINPQFNRALPFLSNELAPVNSGDTWGYINKEGKFEIKPQFDTALPFNGDLALVKSSGQIGMINEEGKFAVNPMFDKVSDDLLQYQIKGESIFNSVTTDYFDIGAITSKIGDLTSYKGIDKNSSFGDIVKKLDITSEDFNEYTKEQLIVEEEKINNDANYSFVALGRPFTGGYGGYDFIPEQKPSGIAFVINLMNRGSGKASDVVESFTHVIPSGFTKSDESTDNRLVYNNNDNGGEIILANKSSRVTIVAQFPEETEKIDSKTDESSADESSNDQAMYKVSDPDGWSNLRATPGGDVITKVYENQPFEVLGSKDSHKKVKLGDGTQGYIHSSRVVEVK